MTFPAGGPNTPVEFFRLRHPQSRCRFDSEMSLRSRDHLTRQRLTLFSHGVLS
jgi:hypothetical protein